MRTKQIVGLIVFLCGMGMWLFSGYIDQRVAEGRGQIGSAQRSVNSGKAVFSLAPSSVQGVGNKFTDSAQSRIDSASAEANHYENQAQLIRYAGIVLAIVGVGIFFLWKK